MKFPFFPLLIAVFFASCNPSPLSQDTPGTISSGIVKDRDGGGFTTGVKFFQVVFHTTTTSGRHACMTATAAGYRLRWLNDTTYILATRNTRTLSDAQTALAGVSSPALPSHTVTEPSTSTVTYLGSTWTYPNVTYPSATLTFLGGKGLSTAQSKAYYSVSSISSSGGTVLGRTLPYNCDGMDCVDEIGLGDCECYYDDANDDEGW